MNILKRIALFVFGVAGVCCLLMLGLTWIGPFQHEAIQLMGNSIYYLAMQACLAITTLGVLYALLRSLFAPRGRKAVLVTKVGGDEISVAKSAIATQASYAIEQGGTFLAERVRVHAGRRKVSVDARVRPLRAMNVAQEGEALHERVENALRNICGDTLQHLNIEFVDAESVEPAQDVVVERVEEERPAQEPRKRSFWSRKPKEEMAEPTGALASDTTTSSEPVEAIVPSAEDGATDASVPDFWNADLSAGTEDADGGELA